MHNASTTLNGSFGKVFHEGEWMTNIHSAEVNIEITYEEIKRAGTRVLGNKATTIKCSGTLTGYTVTNQLRDRAAQIMDPTKGAFVTEILINLEDPENQEMDGYYRLKNVQFNTIPLVKYAHGEVVEEEWPFVFDGYERI